MSQLLRMVEYRYFSKLSKVKVFDVGRDRVVPPGVASGTSDCALSKDNSCFAVVNASGLIQIFSVEKLQLLAVAKCDAPVLSLKYYEDNLVAVTADKKMLVFNSKFEPLSEDMN